MTIGLNLSVVQTPHRMRGIGATAINFVNNLSESQKKKHRFILYFYEADRADALALLNLEGLNYELRTISPPPRLAFKLPGRLRVVNSLLNGFLQARLAQLGSTQLGNFSDVDSYLEFDQMQTLPRLKHTKVGLILYDLIPYIMEADYLWSYKTARRHDCSRKQALKKHMQRKQYIGKIRANAHRANILFAISGHTKKDFIKYLKIRPDRIKVTPLGIDTNQEVHDTASAISFNRYLANGWGYFPKPIDLTTKPFLTFLGGADARRKLSHLVAAYNNMKAQDYDIRLVLAGDTMKGPMSIPTLDIQRSLANSSYLEDIVFLGFVTDSQREWLYANALAMVYPSVYEGFGLPVLEAMRYGTPVITYKNTSITEVAADAVLYADNAHTIMEAAVKLLSDNKLRQKYATLGKKQSSLYSWRATVDAIMSGL